MKNKQIIKQINEAMSLFDLCYASEQEKIAFIKKTSDDYQKSYIDDILPFFNAYIRGLVIARMQLLIEELENEER